MHDSDSEPQGLWQFALQCWKRPQVEATALTLQDRWQLSVCLLLTALWLAQRGLRPDPALAGQLRERADLWEAERIRPLRLLRRLAASRPDWADWKRALQETELEAEKLLLAELAALVEEHPLATLERPAMDAWLLLVVPDMGSCEGLSETLGRLRDSV